MKKRVISLMLALVLLIALTVNGCGILTVNEERDLARSVSTVSYGGYSANVTKGELMEYFVAYADTYINYYGMSAEEVLDLLLEQLNTRKLLVLYAKAELGISASKSGLELEDYNKAISRANDTYNEVWEDYIEDIKKDREEPEDTNGEDPEDEPEEVVEPRPIYTPKTDEEDEEIGEWDVDEDGYVIPFYNRDDLIPADDEYKSVKKAALKELWKALEKNHKPTEYFVNQELENMVIELLLDAVHEKELGTGPDIVISDTAIQAELEKLMAEQKAHITLDSDYRSHLEKGEPVFFIKQNEDDTYGGYGYVKNLLIAFDSDAIANDEEIDDLVAEYTRMSNSKLYKDEVLQAKLAEIVSALEIKNYGTAGYYDGEGLARDREGSEDQTANTATSVIGAIEYKDGRFVAKSGNDFTGTFYQDVLTEVGATMPAIGDAAAKTRIETFVNYIFGYGEDTGMFNNEVDYLVAPEGNSWYEDFTTVSQELIKNCEQNGTGATDIGFSVTPYGLHVIMVTYVPMLYANGYDLTLDTVLNVETGETVYDYIKDKLQAEMDSSTEMTFQKQIINQNRGNFVVHKDVYDSIING